jgi:hypothetical protein
MITFYIVWFDLQIFVVHPEIFEIYFLIGKYTEVFQEKKGDKENNYLFSCIFSLQNISVLSYREDLQRIEWDPTMCMFATSKAMLAIEEMIFPQSTECVLCKSTEGLKSSNLHVYSWPPY